MKATQLFSKPHKKAVNYVQPSTKCIVLRKPQQIDLFCRIWKQLNAVGAGLNVG